MFQIGAFSRLTKVSVRMLRYYDETGLLKPAAVDAGTGYRLYASHQIPTLQKILMLRDMNFGVAEIAAALQQWNPQSVTQLLAGKKEELLQSIQRQQQRIQKIECAIQDMGRNKLDIHYNIVMKEIPSYSILSLRQVVPNYFCEGALWQRLYSWITTERIGLCPGVNNLAIFHDEEPCESGVDLEVGVLVKKSGRSTGPFVYRQTEAVAQMACIMVYGPYENIGPAYHAFAYWLDEHQQYELAGPSRQICHIGAFGSENPEAFLTEVQVPIQCKPASAYAPIFPLDSHTV